MNYFEVKLLIEPFNECSTDIISASLGEIGYESFIIENNILLAYSNENLFNITDLEECIADNQLKFEVKYSYNKIEQKNWN